VKNISAITYCATNPQPHQFNGLGLLQKKDPEYRELNYLDRKILVFSRTPD
jgi:hypothetical protein